MGISSTQQSGGSSALPTERTLVSLAPGRLLAAAVTAVLVLALLALTAPTVAFAAPEAPTPTPPPSLLAPVTIDSPTIGEFVSAVPLIVSGTKAEGSGVQLHTGDSGNPVCIVRASPETTYSCRIDSIVQGSRVPVTAVQLLAGAEESTAQTPIRVLLAPTITSGTTEVSSGFLTGTGFPNATLTLRSPDGRSWPLTVAADGSWAHVLPEGVPSGPLELTATQSTPFSSPFESAASAPVRFTLDRDPPLAPTITTPAAGATLTPGAASYAGTGETGATVTVFAVTASGTDIELCTDVPVTAGRWICTGAAVPAGGATITAYQRDAAGNTGPGAAALTVSFEVPATAPSRAPSASPTDEAVPAPVPAPPAASADPTPEAAPTEPWADQTPFTTAVKGAIGPGTDLTWLRAVLLAIIAIVLLLIPARMLATTIAGRRTIPIGGVRAPLTGRNRLPTHDDPAPLLSTPGAGARTIIALSAAGAIVLFARPVDGAPASLRLFVASVLALVAVNAAATIVPTRFAAWRGLGTPSQRLSWVAFPVVAGAVLLSRVLELQPAFLFGLLFVLSLNDGRQRDRGQLGLARIAAVFLLGLGAWLATTAIGTPVGFAGSFAAELVNIIAMTALGSAALMMVPLGELSGKAVLYWSRPAWFASALVIFTVLFAFLSPTFDAWQERIAVIAVVVAVIGFGAVGISLWLWRRVVAPNLTAS